MKLIVVVSSLELRQPLSSTPSWWQLLKALSECGADLVVSPYQGQPIESPWWEAGANPCRREGDVVGWWKRWAPRSERRSSQLTLTLVNRVTKPRWRRYLVSLMERTRDADAVLFISIPPNHFAGIPGLLAHRFGVPTYFYDGDVPASLPRFQGFQTGFRIYDQADLSEFAGVFSSSLGGISELKDLGARAVAPLYYGADPALFKRPQLDEDIDAFFYGHGAEYRKEWIEAMLVEPARRLPGLRVAVRGTRLGALPRVEQLPYASFSKLKEYCCRSRINLLITRQAHTSVFASSTARPFELAALGCAMVSNPYLGVETWFEPGREILVVRSASDAAACYSTLLRDPVSRREMGERARARLLAEHTYEHRARQLLNALSGQVASAA